MSNRESEIPVPEDAAFRRNPPHPGHAIADGCIGREAARDGGARTVAAAARRLGVSRKQLSRVIHGHCAITPALAVRLEAAGWGSAEAWITWQARFDLARERERTARAA